MFMKRSAITVLALTLFAAPGLVPAAEAGVSLHFGGGFRIGGIFFDIGVQASGGHHQDHYYRTNHRIRYNGYSCSKACYRDGGHDYHHRSCPVVRHHFDRYNYTEAAVYNHYGPRDGYYRYDNRPRYDNQPRYDRRYDNRARYERRDRSERRDRYERRNRSERRERYDRRHRNTCRDRSHRH